MSDIPSSSTPPYGSLEDCCAATTQAQRMGRMCPMCSPTSCLDTGNNLHPVRLTFLCPPHQIALPKILFLLYHSPAQKPEGIPQYF